MISGMTKNKDIDDFLRSLYPFGRYSERDYLEDSGKLRGISNLITRYTKTGILQDQQILNGLITLFNVFGAEMTCELTMRKVNKENWSVLLAFLVYLDYIRLEDWSPLPEVDSIVLNNLHQKRLTKGVNSCQL